MSATFIKHFWYNGYSESDPWPLMRDIKEYCKMNYCEPISLTPLPNCNRNTLLVVMQYRGSVSKKQDTDEKIPNSHKYYYKCSKCGFHLVEAEMELCPGCASHFVCELEADI